MTVTSTAHLHTLKAGSPFVYLRPRPCVALTDEFMLYCIRIVQVCEKITCFRRVTSLNKLLFSMHLDFTVAHQSPHTVTVRDLKDPVPIFAIASQHNLCTEYQWFCVGKETKVSPQPQ